MSLVKVTRDRIVAASIFHVIRAYLLVFKGDETFRGIKFAIDPNWGGWDKLHFYLTRYIIEGGGTIVHSDKEKAEIAIPFTSSNMHSEYSLIIPAVGGATASSKKPVIAMPTTFVTLYDMIFNLVDHHGAGAYKALETVASSVYEAAYHYFYEQDLIRRMLDKDLKKGLK